MPRSAKFRPKSEHQVGDITVAVGRRSNAPAIKMQIAPDCAVIIDIDTADALADALDEALTAYEADPLLWS
jgi:hypothetical protein